MRNLAAENLDLGSKVLQPLFTEHGFLYVPLQTGGSSGGHFAAAEFRRGDRRFEFHFRFSLGMVSYHLSSESITHEEYMLSILGKPYASHYPGFSDDPMDSFRCLREDLEQHCSEFFEGTDEELLLRFKDARMQWSRRPKLPS